MEEVIPLEPFHPLVISFLDAMSKAILSDKSNKAFPDVVTFAFWCRKAGISSFQRSYPGYESRKGRGWILHIAPANVATLFAYSMVSGLLAGNANVVRVSSRPFEQVKIIVNVINELLADQFSALRSYICLIGFPRGLQLTQQLCARADGRVVWGGTGTVSHIRSFPIKPGSADIGFPDRYSFALLNSEAWQAEEDKKKVAMAFYNDTFLTDQLACSAPTFIIWIGRDDKPVREDFWQHVGEFVIKKKVLLQEIVMNKFTTFFALASEWPVKLYKMKTNHITRIEIPAINAAMTRFRPGGGFFLEYSAKNLEEILPLCGVDCQTVVCYGIPKKQVNNFFNEHPVEGIYRIVDIGKALEFSVKWDGIDLIEELSMDKN
jgi:hypothetical protein